MSGTRSSSRKDQEYELLVQTFLQDQLSSFRVDGEHDGAATVFHGKAYAGKSGHSHKIDLSFELEVVGTRLLILIECKCYGRQVEVGEVLEFGKRIEDIGAHKGILVSTSGFQAGAVKVAKASGIALVEAREMTWKVVYRMDIAGGLAHALIAALRNVAGFLFRARSRRRDLERTHALIERLNGAVGLGEPRRIGAYEDVSPIESTNLVRTEILSSVDDEDLDTLSSAFQDSAYRISWETDAPIAFSFVSTGVDLASKDLCFRATSLVQLVGLASLPAGSGNR